ncbi:TPA: helix-turn-helix domain-containing protein [Enterococcus faecium]|uniref:helix-turn-helix domain-containing protein n=1 Tax=Enterococcus faecium TaxID=1352 RepID=UPI0019D903EB|nr:helix-turn-helix domain-containing protein [Enterococcus faecium]EMF0610067.1 helix-turn-helix domain-containing protein [Enterococcus faecium]MBZ3650199.1 helix-turn-helix domain-containing protein [Enterococcus faecium]MCD4909397.1 helix-turn-helix domain-containing protein [Enterococcus faecium]
MGNVDKTAPSLKVEIIVSAVSGDPIAITEVLHHYQKYIMSLSLRSNYDDGSTSSVYVDEFLRRNLETKLIEKILTFDVSR